MQIPTRLRAQRMLCFRYDALQHCPVYAARTGGQLLPRRERSGEQDAVLSQWHVGRRDRHLHPRLPLRRGTGVRGQLLRRARRHVVREQLPLLKKKIAINLVNHTLIIIGKAVADDSILRHQDVKNRTWATRKKIYVDVFFFSGV